MSALAAERFGRCGMFSRESAIDRNSTPQLNGNTMRISLLTLILSCAACNIDGDCTWPDGSSSCDAGPVLESELEGQWCTRDFGTCLTVVHTIRGAEYEWITPACAESGLLTGGLEFTPDGNGQCFGPPGFYSASGDWTDTGLRLFIDAERAPLELYYFGCSSCS